jgi:hypothetical protein
MLTTAQSTPYYHGIITGAAIATCIMSTWLSLWVSTLLMAIISARFVYIDASNGLLNDPPNASRKA